MVRLLKPNSAQRVISIDLLTFLSFRYRTFYFLYFHIKYKISGDRR